jgi:hypothetical protein
MFLRKERPIKRETFGGGWEHPREQIKDAWDEPGPHEIDKLSGRYAKRLGKPQEKYGFSRREAEQEIDDLFSMTNISRSQ